MPEDPTNFLPAGGNYQNLLSYKKSEIIYDFTFRFCERFLKRGDRTIDQMVQAARSGKQKMSPMKPIGPIWKPARRKSWRTSPSA